MTDDEKHEYDLLRLTNEHGKFAIELGGASQTQQDALERLQLRGWVHLIDLSPLPGHPGHLFRIFLAQPDALTWFRGCQ